MFAGIRRALCEAKVIWKSFYGELFSKSVPSVVFIASRSDRQFAPRIVSALPEVEQNDLDLLLDYTLRRLVRFSSALEYA